MGNPYEHKEPSIFPAQLQVSEQQLVEHHPEWLTAVEAAAYLKVKVRTLLLWVRQGKIKGYALSGTKRRVWRFRVGDLDARLHAPSVLQERRTQ
jgi:excisionase family DNA binding protein